MSRQCELTGKGGLVGHLVSHSNIKTKRRYLPNLCNVTLLSDTLGRGVRLRISANALRSVEHRGGLDAFLMKARDEELSLKARRLKREIVKARARTEASRRRRLGGGCQAARRAGKTFRPGCHSSRGFSVSAHKDQQSAGGGLLSQHLVDAAPIEGDNSEARKRRF